MYNVHVIYMINIYNVYAYCMQHTYYTNIIHRKNTNIKNR